MDLGLLGLTAKKFVIVLYLVVMNPMDPKDVQVKEVRAINYGHQYEMLKKTFDTQLECHLHANSGTYKAWVIQNFISENVPFVEMSCQYALPGELEIQARRK